MKTEFDFDYWMELAQTDPKEFERKRLEVLNEVAHALKPDEPEKAERIYATVYNVITRSAKIKNPLSRAAYANDAMEIKLHELNDAWNDNIDAVKGKYIPPEVKDNVVSINSKKNT